MMKKFLLFALAVVLALSLIACDDNNDSRGSSGNNTGGTTINEPAATPEPPPDTSDPADASDEIVGTWAYPIDVSSLLQNEIGEELAAFGEEFAGLFDDLGNSAMLTMLFEFNADGTFRMHADEDSVYAMVNTILERLMYAIYYFMDVMFEELAAEMGITVEDLITAFEEQEDISFSEYMDLAMVEMLNEMGDFDAIFKEFTESGRFKIEGDRLFVAAAGEEFDYYDVFEISGNTLTLLSTSDPNFDSDDFGGIFSYPARLTRR